MNDELDPKKPKQTRGEQEPAEAGAVSGEGGGEAAAEDKAAEYLLTLQRVQADFENYKKRIARDQGLLMQLANERLIGNLLPLLDNFEKAVFVAEHTKEVEGLIKGVEMVYADFIATLEKEGLQEVATEGQPFDPNLHEAVMEVESPDHPPHTVVDVLRKGYTLNGKLIRPAMVKVSQAE